MSPKSFDAHSYWEERLARNTNLLGTGHRAFSLAYNQWLYQAQLDCLEGLLRQQKINIEGKSVLDIGSGTGFFVDYYLRRGADVVGLDIAESSVAYLHRHYPSGKFYVADVSQAPLPVSGPFRVISVISVLYHIVDDGKFEQALRNLIDILDPGGYFVLSDILTTQPFFVGKHAHFRTLAEYEEVFQPAGIKVLAISPMYYWLNQAILPVIGPKIISLFKLGQLFYRWDTALRSKGKKNGNRMKLFIAQKKA